MMFSDPLHIHERTNTTPNKTLHLKREKCSGGKHIKVRLSGLAAGNAYGERFQMFFIGKSVKPRCFKGVKTLPCRYRAGYVWRAFRGLVA